MSVCFPMVRLGEILTKSEEWIDIKPDQKYKQITVRLWGKGVVQRDEVSGAEIAVSKRIVARPQQFIISRIDARNGAFGLVPNFLDGALVSTDFPVFELNHSRALPKYLEWMSKTNFFVELCKFASEGTTNRVRLKEDRFLATAIPLPLLDEQRRIVVRIEELAAKIEEARGLRRQAVKEAQALLDSKADEIFSLLSSRCSVRSFGSFNPHVTSGPRNWSTNYSDTGLRFYRAQDIGCYGRLLESSKVYIVPPETNQGNSAKLQFGDLMIVITGATVGRCTVFSNTSEPGYVSQHVAICRLPSSEVDPFFALWGLLSPLGQKQLIGQQYGQGKPGLNLTNIRAIKLPVPRLNEQIRIVSFLDSLQAKVDRLIHLQDETTVELDALVPSILDKAFKGEL